MMSKSFLTGCYLSPKLLLLFFSLVAVPLVATAAKTDARGSGLSELSVQKQLDKQGGDFSDLILNMKQQADFSRLCRKHRLDDPAVWPELRKRFVLNIAELQGQLNDAKSMMAARDTRGGLNNEVISAEKTREKGRQLRGVLVKRIDEMQQMVRLIDEFKAAFAEMSDEQALTGEMSIENQAGQSFPGKVLFVDGNDLLVKRENVGYFRIPSKLLSEKAKMEVLESVYGSWERLPELVQDDEIKDKNAGELIAYSDTQLYIDDRFEGFVSVPRSESAFIFTPYEERMKSIREEFESNPSRDKSEVQETVNKLKEGFETNQSRLKAIDWYESRLGIEIPESERKEAKAYREEKYGESEKEEDTAGSLENTTAE
jgi:hypothetical protein